MRAPPAHAWVCGAGHQGPECNVWGRRALFMRSCVVAEREVSVEQERAGGGAEGVSHYVQLCTGAVRMLWFQ